MYMYRSIEVRSRIVAVEKQYEYYLLVCACMRAPACVHCVRERVGMCMRVRACSLANPACNAYAPYCDVICVPSASTQFLDIIS